MSAQSQEGKLFRKYQAALINQFGRSALDSDQIETVGKQFFKSHWGGCHASDWKAIKPNKFYVFNTDPSSKPGEHWLGGITTKSTLYLYDSYARNAPALVKDLTKTAKKLGFKVPNPARKKYMEQHGYTSEVCGHDSISYLLVARDLGVRAAVKLI